MQLVFIHGSGGCRESWKSQTQHFEGSEAINLPGHPDGDLCPTIEEYTQWLHRYVQGKGYEDLVLIGHSLGKSGTDYELRVRGRQRVGPWSRVSSGQSTPERRSGVHLSGKCP